MKMFFAVLLLWTLTVNAETIVSKLISNTTLLEKNSGTTSVLTPPDPGKLTADWWRYFEAEANDLQSRINTSGRQLQAILQNLPTEERADPKEQINSIVENLHAMLELRKKTGPELPSPIRLKNTYTLKEWLDIVHKLRTAQAEVQSANEDLLRDVKRLGTSRQHLDSLTAAYLTLPDQSLDKLLKGLTLMKLWSRSAVNSERQRLQKAALLVRKQQLEQLTEENTIAQEKLFMTPRDLQLIQQELEAAQQDFETAKEKTAQLATSTVGDNLETDEGKIKALLFEQKVRHATINEAIADAIVTRKTIELNLARILNAPDTIKLDAFRTELHDNLDHISEIGSRLDLWREETERDQGRAGTSLAALFGTMARQSSKLINLARQRLAEAQDTLLSLQRLDGEIHDARLVAGRLHTLIADREGALKSGLETVKKSSAKIWEQVWEQLETSLFKIGETPVTALGVLRVILIVTLAWTLSHFVRRGLIHLSENQHGNSAFLYTLARLTHYLILVIGISIGLSSIGADLSNFALIAGALSLGIGFGLQAIVSNFVSGLIVLFERSLRIGDFVELSSGLAGEVRAINVRSTLVTTTDMVEILVPNSEFVNGKVINWTLTDASRRIHIPFGVAYGSDKMIVRKAALEAADLTVHTIKNRRGREPEVWLTNFGDSSLDFELIVWVQPQAVKKPQRVRAAYYWELETALRKYGIQIPFPQRDLHIRSGLQQPSILAEEAKHPIIERN